MKPIPQTPNRPGRLRPRVIRGQLVGKVGKFLMAFRVGPFFDGVGWGSEVLRLSVSETLQWFLASRWCSCWRLRPLNVWNRVSSRGVSFGVGLLVDLITRLGLAATAVQPRVWLSAELFRLVLLGCRVVAQLKQLKNWIYLDTNLWLPEKSWAAEYMLYSILISNHKMHVPQQVSLFFQMQLWNQACGMIVASHPRLQCCSRQGSGPVDQPMPSRKCQGLRGPKKYLENKDHVNHVTMLMFLLTLNCTKAFWSKINDSLISIPYPTLGATLQCLTAFLRMLSSAFSQTDSKTVIAVHLSNAKSSWSKKRCERLGWFLHLQQIPSISIMRHEHKEFCWKDDLRDTGKVYTFICGSKCWRYKHHNCKFEWQNATLSPHHSLSQDFRVRLVCTVHAMHLWKVPGYHGAIHQDFEKFDLCNLWFHSDLTMKLLGT